MVRSLDKNEFGVFMKAIISTIKGCVGVAALLAATGGAFAQDATLPAGTVLRFNNTNLTSDVTTANADGSITTEGEQGGASWSLVWDITLKEDPFIAGTLTVRNLSAIARDFNITLSLPTTPPLTSSLYGGSLNAELRDTGGDFSASLQPISTPIFRGTIDGSTTLQLFAIGLNCFGSSAGCTASGSDSSGLPGPTLAGPAVNTSIGTLLSFNLSAGDTVVFTTRFDVVPVPLPAALPLFSMGLVGLFGLRRKNKAS